MIVISSTYPPFLDAAFVADASKASAAPLALKFSQYVLVISITVLLLKASQSPSLAMIIKRSLFFKLNTFTSVYHLPGSEITPKLAEKESPIVRLIASPGLF